MKLRILNLIMMLCTIVYGAKSGNDYKVIKPASEQELAPIVTWAKENQKALEKEDWWPFSCCLEDYSGYIVDINNDGKQEYVFLRHHGICGYTHFMLLIFVKDELGIHHLEAPGYCLDEWEDFTNPITKESELFVYAQGKIYICCSDMYNETRGIRLWENNNISRVCDKYWIQQQRKIFDHLYQTKQYTKAYNFLNNFEKAYRNDIDPQTDLWIRNDLALAALRSDRPYTSLNIINDIKKNKAFEKASPALAKAIKTNEKLCQDAIKEDKASGTKGKYDYSWILSCKDKTAGDFAFDTRFDSLLATTVPDIENPQFEGSWIDDIENHLGRIIQDDLEISSNRYVVLYGCIPHCATHRGFLWCDIKEKISVVAIGVHDNPNAPLYITSRNILTTNLPAKFLHDLRTWLSKEEIVPSTVLFYDYLGTKCQLQLNIEKKIKSEANKDLRLGHIALKYESPF